MLDDEQEKVYSALWWLLLGDGVACIYRDDLPLGDALFTFVEGAVRPAIWVRRSPIPTPANQPNLAGASPRELILLAHERGHEASWHDGSYKPSSMEEERCAWRHAERILLELKFDMVGFETEKKYALMMHEAIGTPE